MKLFITILISLILRIFVSLGGYSGINDPPHFGDFEAQRHWMELTTNLNVTQWYQSSDFNDPNWWPLDYPPLSGYFAYILGKLAEIFDSSIIAPLSSRGIESLNTKIFMRISVFLSELVFLFPPLLYFSKNLNFKQQLTILCCPLLILIDHGHFQYNCIMLGLTLYAVIFLEKGKLIIGSILYTLALNFKIMSLYYSLGFFIYILSKIYTKPIQIIKIGLIVLLTTIIVWLPWITNKELFFQALSKIFPIHRGLYQLHVATFWCITNTIFKWNIYFSNEILFRIAGILTLLFSFPTLIKLFRNPRLFKISLFILSQTFFLFSFHVHEKTILLPIIFLMISQEDYGYIVYDYIIIATITHHPLMKEDKLFIEYLLLLVLFYAFARNKQKPKCKDTWLFNFYNKIRNLPIIFYSIILLAQIYIPPPNKYPFLYELCIQSLGFAMYGFTYLISHTIEKVKLQ